MSPIAVSAPGRICLFGEHQDYLGLPVIAAAIDLRMDLIAEKTSSPWFQVALPDIADRISFENTGRRTEYLLERDYFRSVYNVLLDEGVRLGSGLKGVLASQIPINSGTSSSAAMVLCWIQCLLRAADDPRASDAAFLARVAHRAEVLEFGEPGGIMDHFACAFGGIIFLETQNARVEPLPARLGAFVLGDSGQAKDTRGILARAKQTALDGVAALQRLKPDFELNRTRLEDVRPLFGRLPRDLAESVQANIADRDLLRQARVILLEAEPNHKAFGRLLSRHHQTLSRMKRVSTAKIDAMLDAALSAGALGGKINGSGGGGCMFAYAPDQTRAVAEAIESAGGRTRIIHIGHGVG